MMKVVKAVKPFIYEDNSNFKLAVYDEWVRQGGRFIGSRPYEKYYRRLSYHINLPPLRRNSREARLRFVEGASVRFDTFPDYIGYEVIPMVWDCWPMHVGRMAQWLHKHRVRTAFFTSSQTAEKMRMLCPEIDIFHIPEAIDTKMYTSGKSLRDRDIDYLEYGRCSRAVDSSRLDKKIKVLSSRNEKTGLKTREELAAALSNARITIALTRLDNQPEIAEGIDTLTQRYWECMLSGIILLGRAPKELIDIIGYDPVVPLCTTDTNAQILDILAHIEDYQEMVDRNRETAVKYGDWKCRIHVIMKILTQLGYICY